MRYYLDTNILTYLLYNQDGLTGYVGMELMEYGNILLTSTVCVQELVHIVLIGKAQKIEKGRHKPIAPTSVVRDVTEAGISIVPVTERHLQLYSELPMLADHRDPNDRLIIAQSIADRIPLISSDRKFSRYVRHGLSFIFNER